jgi:hypothetical protein
VLGPNWKGETISKWKQNCRKFCHQLNLKFGREKGNFAGKKGRKYAANDANTATKKCANKYFGQCRHKWTNCKWPTKLDWGIESENVEYFCKGFGSQQKDFPLHHGSLQQLNSSPSNPSMLKIAAIPPFPTAAQKLAQKESVGPASPSKSPSTPVLREASRERLNKYAAAGSPAIYQQQERQKAAMESPHPKYSFTSKNGGGGIGGKDTGTGTNSSRRSSRDGSDLLGGGSNLISHFKNLVNVRMNCGYSFHFELF